MTQLVTTNMTTVCGFGTTVKFLQRAHASTHTISLLARDSGIDFEILC